MQSFQDLMSLLDNEKPDGITGTRAKIETLFSGHKNICVFGMGTYAETVLPYLKMILGGRLFCVSDNDSSKWGVEYCGLRCISPDELLRHKDDCGVFVSVMESGAIVDELVAKGFNSVINVGLDERMVYLALKHMNSYELYKQNRDKLESAFGLLNDERSREVFLAIVHYNLNPFDFDYAGNPLADICQWDQYFPKDIISLGNNEVFVDGGGYTGDTVDAFRKKTNDQFSYVYSFELDANNFKGLELYLAKLPPLVSEKISAYPIGLWDKPDTCAIGGKTVGAHVSKTEFAHSVYAQVDALDNILGNDAQITYIKLDVEGAEENALMGARRIIEKNRPKLAVCAYHHDEDIYKIPLLLHEINPDYRIFLRHHADWWTGEETVCYAV